MKLIQIINLKSIESNNQSILINTITLLKFSVSNRELLV